MLFVMLTQVDCLSAFVGLSVSLTLMSVTRNELAALAAGLTAVVLAGAAGL